MLLRVKRDYRGGPLGRTVAKLINVINVRLFWDLACELKWSRYIHWKNPTLMWAALFHSPRTERSYIPKISWFAVFN